MVGKNLFSNNKRIAAARNEITQKRDLQELYSHNNLPAKQDIERTCNKIYQHLLVTKIIYIKPRIQIKQ